MANQPEMFQNIEVLNANFSSDHRPVRATITLTNHKKNRSKFSNGQHSTLRNEEEASRYKESIKPTYQTNKTAPPPLYKPIMTK